MNVKCIVDRTDQEVAVAVEDLIPDIQAQVTNEEIEISKMN